MKTVKMSSSHTRVTKGSFYSPKLKSNLKYEKVPIIVGGKIVGYELQVERKGKSMRF